MRSIKFRAWDKTDKHMFPGVEPIRGFWGLLDLMRFAEDHYPEKGKAHERYELMQFTGLSDKNGKEIYEGDVVTYQNSPSAKKQQGTVFYETITAEYKLNKVSAFNLGTYGGRYSDRGTSIEVIGNIYENPDLLGEDHGEKNSPDRRFGTHA